MITNVNVNATGIEGETRDQSPMRDGRFREDLYFRLCSDVIQTPSLCEQLAESPDDLQILVRFIARQVLNDDPDEADRLAEEVDTWIKKHLGSEYPWSGNVRELEHFQH